MSTQKRNAALDKFRGGVGSAGGPRRPLHQPGVTLQALEGFEFKEGTNANNKGDVWWRIDSKIVAILDGKEPCDYEVKGQVVRLPGTLPKGSAATQIIKVNPKYDYFALGELKGFLEAAETARGLTPEQVVQSLGITDEDGKTVGLDEGGDDREAMEKYCDPVWFNANVKGKLFLINICEPGTALVKKPKEGDKMPVFANVRWAYDAGVVAAYKAGDLE